MGGYALSDTIVAPATAPVPSALGIIRLSGPRSIELARGLWPDAPPAIEHHRLYVAGLTIPFADETEPLREKAVVTCFQAPNSYTGEDVVEISVHGSPALVRGLLTALARAGARPAEAGEFTYRAFLNGKLDLVQAEAVQQLISAGSVKALALAQSALSGGLSLLVRGWVDDLTRVLAGIEVIHDYAADGLDASLDETELLNPASLAERLADTAAQITTALADSRRTAPLREGVTIALLGPPNVGKSTLFNALLGHERALVAAEPGTTRDYLTETVSAAGLRLTLVDTAGYRDASDAIEAAGVRLSGDWGRTADRVLWVTAADGDFAPIPDDLRASALNVITRCDLLPRWPGMPPEVPSCEPGETFYVSGTTGRGIDWLWKALETCAGEIAMPALAAFGERQAAQLERSLEHLELARETLTGELPLDAVAQDLYAGVEALRGVYEHSDRQAVIDQVFSSFCVGK